MIRSHVKDGVLAALPGDASHLRQSPVPQPADEGDLADDIGALDIIDLGSFGFTGTQKSALGNLGALANSAVDGSTLSSTGFFTVGGVTRGVAIGTNGGNTWVFVDADKDGRLTPAEFATTAPKRAASALAPATSWRVRDAGLRGLVVPER